MPKFRKKPVVIEAFQWLPNNEYAAGRAAGWMEAGGCDFAVGGAHYAVTIRTLEGDMDAQDGDWIIKGVKGEFYPCKPDIFEATYEPAE